MTMAEMPVIGARLKSEPVFLELVSWAKGVARALGHEELNLEHFALGAHLAHKNGKLADEPTLDAHLAAHDMQFAAYFRVNSPGLGKVEPVSDSLHAVHDFDLAAAKAELLDDNPVLNLLNKALAQILDDEMLERVAIHEAGHAVINLVLRPEVRIKGASIKPSSYYQGVVMWDTSSPHFSGHHAHTLEDIKDELCISLAGQMATVRAFGADAANVGVGSDMQHATTIAFEAIALQGLDPDFGPIHLPTIAKLLHEHTGTPVPAGYLFDEAQRRTQTLIKSASEQTRHLVEKHWDDIQRVSKLLLENEVVDENAIRTAMKV